MSVFVGLPLLVLQLVRKWLLRHRHRRAATAVPGVSAAFVLLCSYVVYAAFFPPDSQFESEFEQIAGVPFPASGDVIEGDESGLDPHGDYASCARIQVSRADYDQLLLQLDADTTFRVAEGSVTASFISSQEYQKVTKTLPPNCYYRTFSKGNTWDTTFYFVGFLQNRRTVVAYRCSS